MAQQNGRLNSKEVGSKIAETTHIRPGETKSITIYPNRDVITKELIFLGNDLIEQLGF